MSRTQELWTFDKLSLQKTVFGEFENNFSVSITLDQSRDSTKVIVRNYNSNVLKPNTICYMPTLGMWWIVASDKATRHSGNLYEHELQLLGAIEILAHRDMINCGFNKDRYTLGSFLTRLASFIDFELPIYFDYEYFNSLVNIGYIKTFENYTPLSAIKEMLNGINAIPKMTFEITGNVLTSATIHIIPKTGHGEKIDISEFDDEREIKTIDRNSYGSTVISNTQNCVVSEIVRYPLDGGVCFGSQTGKDEWENVEVSLPFNADYVEKISISGKRYNLRGTNSENSSYWLGDTVNVSGMQLEDLMYDLSTKLGREKFFIKNIYNHATTAQKVFLDNEKEEILEAIEEYGCLTFYNGTSFTFNRSWDAIPVKSEEASFNDNLKKATSSYADNCMYWEQGSNKIKNFSWLGKWCLQATKLFNNNQSASDYLQFVIYDKHGIKVTILPLIESGFFKNTVRFVVHYRPQVSAKLKLDNDINGKDTNIYNQNGKLVDEVALSKLISSHSNEIKSEEITRFAVYKKIDYIPSIGSIVVDGDTKYVINNLSLDFSELEDDYYVKATITLTRDTACKSTMVSGNNNIRDYDCPQKYNVNREQIYRDYYEFRYTQPTTYDDDYYLNNLSSLLSFGNKGYGNENYMCYIKVSNPQYTSLYFKLETTRFTICKGSIVSVDFVDNNIIGYCKGNTTVPVLNLFALFNIEELYTMPITYTDSKGEFTSIELMLVDSDQYYTQCVDYFVSQEYSQENLMYFYYQPMISNTMWEQAENDEHRLFISEPDYKKDGLEKPKFEFITQFGNANGIVIGNDFLKGATCDSEHIIVFYFYETDREINEDNVGGNASDYIGGAGSNVTVLNACEFYYNNNGMLRIFLNSRITYNRTNGVKVLTFPNTIDLKDKNIVICMAKVGMSGFITEQRVLLGLNNVKVSALDHLDLYLEHYKLK